MNTREIKWKSTKADRELIQQIAARAVAAAKDANIPYELQTIMMDITATHLNGTPLDLARLLKADNFNFCHDIFAIRRHLDRTTGKLDPTFCPRFARPVVSK